MNTIIRNNLPTSMISAETLSVYLMIDYRVTHKPLNCGSTVCYSQGKGAGQVFHGITKMGSSLLTKFKNKNQKKKKKPNKVKQKILTTIKPT